LPQGRRAFAPRCRDEILQVYTSDRIPRSVYDRNSNENLELDELALFLTLLLLVHIIENGDRLSSSSLWASSILKDNVP
jgi:hypothetical protein